MATNPTDYLSGLGGLQSMPGSYQIQQTVALDKLRQQLGQQQVQAGQQALAANQLKADEQAQFKIDAQAYAANPTANGAATLLAKYPDQQKAISESWKTKDEATRQADLRQIGAVHSYLANGKVDAAIDEMQSRINAERAAGQDVTDDERLIARLKSDPSTAKAVQAQLALQLASVVPEKFGGVVDQLTKDNDGKGQTVGRAIGHYETGADGTRSFKVDYRDPESETPHFYSLKDAQGVEHEFVYQGGALPQGATLGGAGGAPGQRFTGGWTPRQRNGGDNPDQAVDNKITGVAKALGVDPDADISTLSPAAIAKALAFGEGGSGSLADRNNNPTNLRSAADGTYRKFPSTDAAITAAASQVKRNLGRGQTTVRQMIEGLPTGGSASSAGLPGSRQIDGTPFADKPNADLIGSAFLDSLPASRRNLLLAIRDGRAAPPKPGSKFGEQLAQDATNAFPDIDTTTFASRQKARSEFTGNGKGAQNVSALNRFYSHLNDAYDIHLKLGGPNLGPLSGVAAHIGQAFSPKEVNDYNTAIEGLQGEFQKLTKNGQGNESEAARLIESAKAAQSAEGRLGALQALAKLAAAQVEPLHDQWSAAFPEKSIPIDITPASRAIYQNVVAGGSHAIGIDKNGTPVVPKNYKGGDDAQAPAGAKQIGTYQGKPVFQLPNGKRVVQQ